MNLILFSKVKAALRITDTEFDEEIQLLIDSCKLDLQLAGVNVLLFDGELIPAIYETAVILYCKAYFGYEENADKLIERYNNRKIALALSTEYQQSEV